MLQDSVAARHLRDAASSLLDAESCAGARTAGHTLLEKPGCDRRAPVRHARGTIHKRSGRTVRLRCWPEVACWVIRPRLPVRWAAAAYADLRPDSRTKGSPVANLPRTMPLRSWSSSDPAAPASILAEDIRGNAGRPFHFGRRSPGVKRGHHSLDLTSIASNRSKGAKSLRLMDGPRRGASTSRSTSTTSRRRPRT